MFNIVFRKGSSVAFCTATISLSSAFLCCAIGRSADAQGAKSAGVKATFQTVESAGVSCSVVAPPGFTKSTRDTPAGRMFIFLDPKAPQTEFAGMSIAIVPVGKVKPNQREVMEGVLDVYRKELVSYSEKEGPAKKINGRDFEVKTYAGQFSKTNGRTGGSVYITTYLNSYVILMPQTNGAVGLRSMPKLLKAIDSITLSPSKTAR